MDFVFWQNMPTHHQASWIAALAAAENCAVRVTLDTGIPEWRRKIGWEAPDYGAAVVEVGLTPEKANRIISDAGPNAVHVFSGLGAYASIHRGLRQCAREARHLGVMSESGATGGVKGLGAVSLGYLRRLRYAGGIEFILAIGEGGPPWFERLGFRSERVFEFAYFPPAPSSSEKANEGLWPPDAVRLLFIGRLIHLKGVDLVIRALAESRRRDWCLSLIGSGGEEASLRGLARQLGISGQLQFCGSMRNSEAMNAVSGADVLLLPSRLPDGYGAVVNEALLRGVPVICSSQCGARQVVKTHSEFGVVFESTSGLRSALEELIAKGRRTEESARSIRDLAQCLTPRAGAGYFLDIIRHVYDGAPRPSAPWRVGQSCVANS
jgi:glycosyltransferase involved in cell wall biosynthesis